MMATLLALATIFAELSLLAFGGGNTVLPEMQRRLVDVHHWMTAPEFGALYALAQAAPGPNMMVAPLVGWRVAGLPGALVAALAMFGPSSIVTGLAMHAWERTGSHRWRPLVQAALPPITAGLVSASAIVIARATSTHWALAVVTALAAAVMTVTRFHPLIVLAAGALIGATGWGQS